MWIIYSSNVYIPRMQITGLTIATVLVIFVADNLFIENHETIFSFDTISNKKQDHDSKIIDEDLDNIVESIPDEKIEYIVKSSGDEI